MKKIIVSLIVFTLFLTGCGMGSKAPKAEDVMDFMSTVYTSKALKGQEYGPYKFTNKFTEEISYEATAFAGINDEDDFLELKQAFFEKMFDSAEYHVGEIVKEKDVYTTKLYIAPLDFSFYNLNNAYDLIELYDEIFKTLYPDMTPTERLDLTSKYANDKRTELLLESGETIYMTDYTSFVGIVSLMDDVINETGDVVLTSTSDSDIRSDVFVPTYFEVEFEFEFKDGEIIPLAFNGEAVTDAKDMPEVIVNNSLHFASSEEAKKERETNSHNYINDVFDTSLFKDVKEEKK